MGRIVCWPLGDPSDGGREDLASSSPLSGSSPYGSPGGGRTSPLCGEPPTGEPCAGNPHARFGGRRGRELNRSFLPLSPLPVAYPSLSPSQSDDVHVDRDGTGPSTTCPTWLIARSRSLDRSLLGNFRGKEVGLCPTQRHPVRRCWAEPDLSRFTSRRH